MKPDIKAGTLFDAHSTFMTITGQRFDAMMKRLEKKGLVDEKTRPFTKDELREDVLSVFNGHEDGASQCRYCKGFYTLAEIAIDHAMPLSRGGALDLTNLDYPCANCNNAKGSLTPTEFLKLVDFLEREIPLGRKDVLGRLAKAVSLAQGMRSNMGVIGDLKKEGTWQRAQAARREKKSGLGPF
jgi:5-methylcytosine-specific restriction endonuclease McrA